MRDMLNDIDVKRVLSPAAAVTGDTPQVGAIIDRRGYDSLTYIIATGLLADADATFTVLLEESDDSGMSGASAVDDADLVGTEALARFNYGDDNECRKLGYRGSKRYTRLTITPANNTTAAYMTAVAILGHPTQAPTANPPA